MKVDKETLHKIAHLARLEIDPSKEEALMKDLEEILTWVEKLKELDTSEVEPLTSMSAEINKTREDVVGNQLDKESGLKHGPDTDGDFFRVPKVLE